MEPKRPEKSKGGQHQRDGDTDHKARAMTVREAAGEWGDAGAHSADKSEYPGGLGSVVVGRSLQKKNQSLVIRLNTKCSLSFSKLL